MGNGNWVVESMNIPRSLGRLAVGGLVVMPLCVVIVVVLYLYVCHGTSYSPDGSDGVGLGGGVAGRPRAYLGSQHLRIQ